MLKHWVRRRKIFKLPMHPNDSTLRCPPEDEKENEDEDDGGEGLKGEGRST
jgi:hypothetical protein